MSVPKLIKHIFARQHESTWRVSKAKKLVKEMCKKHENCNYRALLDYFCPLPRLSSGSDESSNLFSLNVERNSINRFLRCVLKKVIPLNLLGSNRNRNVFFKSLSTLTSMGRFDKIPLHEFMRFIKVSDFLWLNSDKQSHTSTSDYLKKCQMIQELILWLINGYIIPLLKVLHTKIV